MLKYDLDISYLHKLSNSSISFWSLSKLSKQLLSIPTFFRVFRISYVIVMTADQVYIHRITDVGLTFRTPLVDEKVDSHVGKSLKGTLSMMRWYFACLYSHDSIPSHHPHNRFIPQASVIP